MSKPVPTQRAWPSATASPMLFSYLPGSDDPAPDYAMSLRTVCWVSIFAAWAALLRWSKVLREARVPNLGIHTFLLTRGTRTRACLGDDGDTDAPPLRSGLYFFTPTLPALIYLGGTTGARPDSQALLRN
jgi:hypothetical protein